MLKRFCFLIILTLVFTVSAAVPVEAEETIEFYPEIILIASFTGDEILTREALALDVDRNIRTVTGDTALHLAMFQNNMVVVELLLEHGFNPNAVNNRGETPLHIAVIANNRSAAELLLRYRADKNIRNLIGSTPLDEARRIPDRRQLMFLLM